MTQGNTTGGGGGLASPVGIADGGTGQTTQTEGFDALSPTTTKGDVIVSDGSDNIRLAIGADDTVLTADAAEASGVKWAAGGGGAETDRFDAISQATISNMSIPLGPVTLSPIGSAVNSTISNAGFILYYPAYIPKTITYNNLYITVHVSATAGDDVEIILYSYGSDGLPDVKVFESGAISLNGTGLKTVVVDQELTAGRYWVGYLIDSGNVGDGNIYVVADTNYGALPLAFVLTTTITTEETCLYSGGGTITVGNALTNPTIDGTTAKVMPLITIGID
tara:strand:+ start:21535 stop:22371 length:837 start_codon:yes stop_codon:yes gene_type:complete